VVVMHLNAYKICQIYFRPAVDAEFASYQFAQQVALAIVYELLWALLQVTIYTSYQT
jgi:hypothetical protein